MVRNHIRNVVALGLVVVLSGACSGSGSTPGAEVPGDTATTVQERAAPETSSSLPSGAVAGLDDYDADGQRDPTCGTRDFGAGLVLRVPCMIVSASEPPEGTRLVRSSLFGFPSENPPEIVGTSGDVIVARDAGGARVRVIIFNTDALFEVGSATLGSTESMDGALRLINSFGPAGVVQVRGHTDATGSAAANQALSDRRAAAAKDYLQSHGVKATAITSVGLASTQPLAEERKPDGGDDVEGRRFNRRVEVVVRLP